MGDLDPANDDALSIFDQTPPQPAADSQPESEAAPDTRLGPLVGEFLTLDRRRVHGDPVLTPAEDQRLAELQETLEYEFGAGSPPLSGSRRSSLRIPTELKVNAQPGPDSVATLCSLSRGGGFLETAQPPDSGTTMELAIDPGAGGAPLHIAATVKWVREIANMNGPAGAGVEFEAIEDDDCIALEKLMTSLLYALARERS